MFTIALSSLLKEMPDGFILTNPKLQAEVINYGLIENLFIPSVSE